MLSSKELLIRIAFCKNSIIIIFKNYSIFQSNDVDKTKRCFTIRLAQCITLYPIIQIKIYEKYVKSLL